MAGDPGTSYGWLDSEGLIRRDKFINIATAAFSTEAWNAYNWYIYDSQFTNCARGLTNEFGAGNFNAYRSVFQNSTVADITINNTYFFGFEDNWSSGSHQFFHSTSTGAGSQILMRGNTILNTANSVAVELGNTGALTLIDNNFLTKTGASGPVIHASNGQGTVLSIGNQYTVTNAIGIVSGVRLITINDQTVTASTISQTLPTLPGTAPNLNRPVFEIPSGANAATIQSIIGQAEGSVGNRPVVHFPAGSYSIASTLNIPANTDLQLEGDTWATQLNWTGGTTGIIFDLAGPSLAKFGHMSMNGSGKADCIDVEAADQPGARVYNTMTDSSDNSQNNVLADGVTGTEIDFEYLGHSLHKGGVSIKAIGGGGASRIAIFGGASSGTSGSAFYDVQKNGQIMTENMYYEGSIPQVTNFTSASSGTFTLTGKIAPYNNVCGGYGAIVNGLSGKATFLNIITDYCAGFLVAGNNSNQHALVVGSQVDTTSSAGGFVNQSSGGNWGLVAHQYEDSAGHGLQASNQGSADPNFILSMLQQMRSLHSNYLNPLAPGVTDVRLFSVRTAYGIVGLHIKPGTGNPASSDTSPPTAPGSLTAAAASSSQINLGWTASKDNVGVTGYLVERCQGAGCTSFVQMATSTGTTYNDTGRAGNTSYSYRVRATDAAGNLSPYSNIASATTPQGTTTSSQGTTSGLVAAYGFNEATGTTVADASGNGNTGTITNAAWTTGKYGAGLSFNGTNALVTINDSASLRLTAAMTLEAWVKMASVVNQWEDIVYKGNDNYFLEATSSKNVPAGGGTFGTAGAAVYGTSALPPNTWTHLAVTYDGATLRLYVNGVQVSSLARTGNIVTSTNPLQIGGDSLFRQYFNGIIDEVRVYNVALTAAQIQTDMNAAIGGSGDTQPPTVPSNLTATVASSSQINLSWTASTDNVGVTGYLVERCQGAGCTSFAQIATSTGTIYNDTGRAPNTAYSYRVRAMDAAGNLSPYSNVASATTQASTPGLVAAYGFNEGTGTTVADASGHGNTGTISNATWTTGKYGKGLSFNGSNTLVTINDSASLHLTAAMTLEAWVNMGIVDNQWEDIVYKGNDNYYLEATSSKNVPAGGGTFGTAGAAAYGTSALPQNAWTHVAVTYDGATLRLYVNGVQVSSLARTGNLVTSTNPLQIGGDSFYRQYFHGIIDEVRVYNVALTAAQIQTDIGNPLP